MLTLLVVSNLAVVVGDIVVAVEVVDVDEGLFILLGVTATFLKEGSKLSLI